MTAAADMLRRGLDQSLDAEAPQIAMTEGSRLVLQAMLRNELPAAVSQGIREALTQDVARQFADEFIKAMKAQATGQVDSWAGGFVRGMFHKLFANFGLFLIAGMIVYSVGGWTAVAGLFKWFAWHALGVDLK